MGLGDTIYLPSRKIIYLFVIRPMGVLCFALLFLSFITLVKQGYSERHIVRINKTRSKHSIVLEASVVTARIKANSATSVCIGS